jgi:hypothetical protein
VAGWQFQGGEGLMHDMYVLASEFAIEWEMGQVLDDSFFHFPNGLLC